MHSYLATALSTFCLVALSSAPQARSAFQEPSLEPGLEQRLERLAERMEAERVAQHIPGFALAVVKDDKVVMARGFGVADVESGRPVEADTIFAIGSTTKAFTATVIGILQDEGTLTFDDPVVKYLPFFELPIEGPDSRGDDTVTLRDLLAHRTGFTRMSSLWAGGDLPRQLILETAVNAEPWAGFRETFLYNNVMFLAAGVASAEAAGAEWEELVRGLLFEPLGMSSSTLSRGELEGEERLSLGYEWDADAEVFQHKQMIELRSIGPAGSINSNVLDMARWLRLQLGRGSFEGERLVSEEALEQTWSPSMSMGGGTSYGMGWMLREHDGQRVVEHGGNIDGFGAEVAFMPEAGVGFVLLTNVTATPLQQGSIGIVFDALLGEEEEPAASDAELQPYLGKYIANFGAFDDQRFEVSIEDGSLAVDIPGQMVYGLKAPDAEGKWVFALTDAIAISFEEDDEGRVIALRMHQSGLTFDLPREGVVRAPEIPLAELEPFIGHYKDPAFEEPLEVRIQNDRLAVDIPGQMAFELEAPDEEGKRYFRATPDLAIRFESDSDGAIVAFTFFERGTERTAVRRGDAPEAAPRPTLEELFELRGTMAFARLLREQGSVRLQGTIRLAQSGIEGEFHVELRADPPANRMRMDFGPFGGLETGSGAASAWSFTNMRGYKELNGMELRQQLAAHPLTLDGDWREVFDEVSVERYDELEGRPVIVAQVSKEDMPSRTMLVDAENGRLLRMDYIHVEGTMQLPMRRDFADFREVEGVLVPFESIDSNDATGRMIMRVKKVEVGVELAEDFYVYDDEER